MSDRPGAIPSPQDAPGQWREISPVVATSSEGLIYGRLETREPCDVEDVARQRDRARVEARRSAYLLATAGHDLRQPLQVILLALDRCTTRDLAAGRTDWVSIARAEVRSLAASLTDLARAARLSEPVAMSTRVGDVLSQAAGAWRQHAAVKGLRLVVVNTEAVVVADPHLLLTALRNLIGNAVAHTRMGRVIAGVRRLPHGLRIDVIDTGPGLDIDNARTLFEPHRRGASEAGGLGLGLAIVLDAAERLGAELTVASAPGRGARFSLTFPLAK